MLSLPVCHPRARDGEGLSGSPHGPNVSAASLTNIVSLFHTGKCQQCGNAVRQAAVVARDGRSLHWVQRVRRLWWTVQWQEQHQTAAWWNCEDQHARGAIKNETASDENRFESSFTVALRSSTAAVNRGSKERERERNRMREWVHSSVDSGCALVHLSHPFARWRASAASAANVPSHIFIITHSHFGPLRRQSLGAGRPVPVATRSFAFPPFTLAFTVHNHHHPHRLADPSLSTPAFDVHLKLYSWCLTNKNLASVTVYAMCQSATAAERPATAWAGRTKTKNTESRLYSVAM